MEVLSGMALCAGIGGLEIGLGLAVPGYRTVCYVEREAYNAAVIVAGMETEALDLGPIWDDVTTFDGRPWRGTVDIITAGFPCQPFSYAGKRKGTEDERWIWPDIARIIRQVGPGIVFLENVPGLLGAGLGPVLGDLAQMGYDAVWGCFTAAEVGASHKRERVFILANGHSPGRQQISRGALGHESQDEGWPEKHGDQPSGCGEDVANGQGCDRGLFVQPGRPRQAGDESGGGGEDVADSDGSRFQETWPELQPTGIERNGQDVAHPPLQPQRKPDNEAAASDQGRAAWKAARRRGLPLFPPSPDDLDAWAGVLRQDPSLAPALAYGNGGYGDGVYERQQSGHLETHAGGDGSGAKAETAQGKTKEKDNASSPQSQIRLLADGPASRTDQLRALGNGVVSLQAAYAFRTLAAAAGLMHG